MTYSSACMHCSRQSSAWHLLRRWRTILQGEGNPLAIGHRIPNAILYVSWHEGAYETPMFGKALNTVEYHVVLLLPHWPVTWHSDNQPLYLTWWTSWWMERSCITPIPKHGDRTNPSNYHPISLLSILSKLVEKHMAQLLTKHMVVNSPISHQSGFCKRKTTAGALYWHLINGTGILRKVMTYVPCSLTTEKHSTQFHTETYCLNWNPLVLTRMYSDGWLIISVNVSNSYVLANGSN